MSLVLNDLQVTSTVESFLQFEKQKLENEIEFSWWITTVLRCSHLKNEYDPISLSDENNDSKERRFWTLENE